MIEKEGPWAEDLSPKVKKDSLCLYDPNQTKTRSGSQDPTAEQSYDFIPANLAGVKPFRLHFAGIRI